MIHDGIYYSPNKDGTTHFCSVLNKKWKDPYDYFQFPFSHGFCQLFAYFLNINDLKDFQKVNFSKISLNNFEKYCYNTFKCLDKFIKILETNKDISKNFEIEFKQLDKEKYGICKETTYQMFLSDLKYLTEEMVKYYIFEFYQDYKDFKKNKEYNEKVIREIQEKYPYLKNEILNKELRVQPTEGESHFESYQAIIAYILNAEIDSPYSLLLNKNNIKLIVKKKFI